jgi:hypothetical protein
VTPADLLRQVEAERKRLVLYAGEGGGDELRGFETRNATVIRRRLPAGATSGFVVVRSSDDEFLGAIPVSRLRHVLEAPAGDLDDVDGAGRQAVLELLDDAVFASLERRHLLVASREIEGFAWRVGRGRLDVGFQRVEAFHRQRHVYERLAAETDLDVHVYAESSPDDAPAGVTFHSEPAEEVRRFWFLVFEAPGDGERARALLARQRDDDRYSGFWTYDARLVADIGAAVRGLRE